MKSHFLLGGAAAIALLDCASPALAQDALDRADPLIAESETTESEDPKPPVESPVTAKPDAAPATPTQAAVQVGAVRLIGLEVLDQSDFMDVIEPLLGTTLDAEGQRALVKAITARLHALDYPLARAVIEPQGIAAGILHVRVDEGRIDALRIEGDHNGLIDRMFGRLANGKPVRGADLQRALRLAEIVPGIRVSRAELKSEGPLNILVVRLRESRSDGRLVADNWGSDTIGPVKLRGRFEQRALLTDGDEVTLYAVTTPADPSEYVYASLGYAAPVDADGTRIGVSGSIARIDAVGAFSGRELDGEGERIRAWVEHPVLLSANASIEAAFGFALRETRQFRDGEPSRDDRVATLSAQLNGSFRIDGVRSFGRIEVTQGTGWFDSTREGDPLASRDDGDARFTLIEASGSVIAPITGPLSVRVDGKAQFASRPLLSGDEFGFGGPNFGRGYYFREASGDNTVAGAVELRVDVPRIGPVVESAQVYGYADAARLWNLRDGRDYRLATAGAGLRARITRDLGFGVEFGVPLDKDRDPRANVELWLRF